MEVKLKPRDTRFLFRVFRNPHAFKQAPPGSRSHLQATVVLHTAAFLPCIVSSFDMFLAGLVSTLRQVSVLRGKRPPGNTLVAYWYALRY